MNNNLYWNVYKSLERELLALADIIHIDDGQPFCGMSAIRFNVLDDRAFPQVCSRTLVKCKGSGFLGISVVYG